MKQQFPKITMALGLILVLVLHRFAPGRAEGEGMPLLTALFIAEFGFLVTLGAAIYSALDIRRVGARRQNLSQLLGNGLLAALFVYYGLDTWSRVAAAAG